MHDNDLSINRARERERARERLLGGEVKAC